MDKNHDKTHATIRVPGFGRSSRLGLRSPCWRTPTKVTVFDAGGKVAFKGPVSANATFATRNLPAGNYVVRFNAESAAVKGNHYLLVVSAGKKKVIAAAVPGDKLTGGGAAMKIAVGPSLKITGHVANEQAVARAGASNLRIIGGKRYVWVTTELGSNLGHWVEEGSPPARNIIRLSSDDLRRRQDRSGEGSMIPYSHHHTEPHGD